MDSVKIKTLLLMRGNNGKDVAALKKACARPWAKPQRLTPAWPPAMNSTPTPKPPCAPGNPAWPGGGRHCRAAHLLRPGPHTPPKLDVSVDTARCAVVSLHQVSASRKICPM